VDLLYGCWKWCLSILQVRCGGICSVWVSKAAATCRSCGFSACSVGEVSIILNFSQRHIARYLFYVLFSQPGDMEQQGYPLGKRQI